MFVHPNEGAAASTVPAAKAAANLSSEIAAQLPTHWANPDREHIRHLLLGSLPAVQATIAQLHKRGYAEANDWSRPLPTGRPNEVMAILTKRISPPPQTPSP